MVGLGGDSEFRHGRSGRTFGEGVMKELMMARLEELVQGYLDAVTETESDETIRDIGPDDRVRDFILASYIVMYEGH
jgi:hypothetical protein